MFFNNIYELLEDMSDDDSGSKIDFDSKIDSDSIVVDDNISLEFTNSKVISSHKRKRPNGRNNPKLPKTISHVTKSSKSKSNPNYSKSFKFKSPYNEMDDLPQDMEEAISKRQNLTLKQILVLMCLHSIPGIALNVIHDRLQLEVKRKQIKINYDSRVFYVSQYNWYDLKRIEMMIDSMFSVY